MTDYPLRERSPEARDAYFQGYRAGFEEAVRRASGLCQVMSSDQVALFAVALQNAIATLAPQPAPGKDKEGT